VNQQEFSPLRRKKKEDSSSIFMKRKREKTMLEFKFDTQLLIEGHDLDEDVINEYFTKNFKGDCLLAVGDDELIKIHYHTNEPWKVLEYCSSLGEIYDIVVENMERQEQGLHG
jgi:dihydroxyacetone kinase-like predicted kinase